MRYARLGVAMLILVGSYAKAAEPQNLASTLQPILAKHQTPALWGAIVDGGQVVALGAVGVRKFGSPERVTVNDLVHLGSDTKAMTAVLITQLIEKKQLAFDTPMNRIFPDLAAKMNGAMAKVTVRQLLDHTGGLPENPSDWWAYDRSKESLPAQRRQLVKDMLDAAPDYPPGTKFQYSNVGFVMLGAIVEQKTGLPWEEVIQQEIFGPLKMESAGFGPPGAIGKIEQPWGHTISNGALVANQGDNPPIMSPAGRVHCSMTDWAKFVAQFLKTHADQPALLPAMLQHELIMLPATPKGTTYAGGWIVTERSWAGEGNGTVLTHTGSNNSWLCVAWLAPGKDFGVLAATNVGGDDASAACDEVSAALIGIHGAQR